MSVIPGQETTIYGTALYFISWRGHISAADVPRRAGSNEVIRRRSSTGATSINLEYLMHANE